MIELKLKSHEDLIVWQKSMSLVELVYATTRDFPKEELYGLTSQMRRAVTAIPTNITEGYHRNHSKEYIQFLYISKSSAWELQTLVQIADRLKIINQTDKIQVEGLLSEILKMLTTMISKLKEKYHNNPKP